MAIKHSYHFNRKRMMLEKDVFKRINDMNIDWDSIQHEKRRLMSLGHPPPVSDNLAARLLIDKHSEKTISNGIKAIHSTSSNDFFSLKTNRKGFIGDNITLAISLMVIIALTVLLGSYITNQNTNIQSSSADTVFKSTFNSSTSGISTAMDKGLVVGIVLLVGFLLYSAYNISSNFALFMLALITNCIALFLLPIAEDFLVTSYYNNNFAAATSAMPATFYIINNYTVFLSAVFGLLLIATYLGSKNGGQA